MEHHLPSHAALKEQRGVPCTVCGQMRRSVLQGRAICSACYKQEPSISCQRCARLSHHIDAETGLCPACVRVTARSTGTCAKCKKERIIFESERMLCEQCVEIIRGQQRYQARQPVVCSVCGKSRRSVMASRAICNACYTAEHQRAAYGCCANCHRDRRIANKAQQLCKSCYKEQCAPRQFHQYVTRFTSPYPYNNELFALLAATIDPEQVKDFVVQQFRAFGTFLQTHSFTAPVTWEMLEAALPLASASASWHQQQIRALLLHLGHTLAARGQLETREVFLERQVTSRILERVPPSLLPITRRYDDFLTKRAYRPRSIQHKLTVLADFWCWCTRHAILSPASVAEEAVEQYLRELRYSWQCKACAAVKPYDSDQQGGVFTCERCGETQPFVKVRRLQQITINIYRKELHTFFAWAIKKQLVLVNPAKQKGPPRYHPIRHYPISVIETLCHHMVSPDADPTEALVVYLVIFHALSSWEIHHAKIPLLQREGSDKPLSLAEAYSITVPRRSASPGNLSPGRPSEQLTFLSDAAQWLKPVLERFEQQRLQLVTDPANQYLFVPLSRHRQNAAASQYADGVVQRISRRVLGKRCTLAMVRKTAVVLLADTSGGTLLTRLGWTGHSAYHYVWNDREIVVPQ